MSDTGTESRPPSGAIDDTVLDVAVAQEAVEYCYEQGWTDGLPVVPCTAELLERFLATVDRDPDDVVLTMSHLNRACTVRAAAINAAMAGCLPAYLPVVIAGLEALATEGYAPTGLWQSTTGTAPCLLVNGPIRERLGVNSRGNVYGSGFRANATIGRAFRLIGLNTFGVRPHELDQATQATPAKYTCCIAENEEASPWSPFHVDHGFDTSQSTVTALTMRSSLHIEARHTVVPEQLLLDIAHSLARTGAMIHPTTSGCVVLGPEHAALLANAGWSKRDVQQFLFEQAVSSQDELDRVGKGAVSTVTKWRLATDHPDAAPHEGPRRDDGAVHALNSPEAVLVVVAGAANAGVSSVIETFGPRGDAPAIAPIGGAA